MDSDLDVNDTSKTLNLVEADDNDAVDFNDKTVK